MSSWKTKDSGWLTLPEHAKTGIDKVNVVHRKNTKIMVQGTEVKVAYREARPETPKLDVLLLHGMRFKSQTWVEDPLYTLQILCNLGYRAVAIDLPGFGDSPSPAASIDRTVYLESVIAGLGLTAPVIISPSMSGSFSLPYLFKRFGESPSPADTIDRAVYLESLIACLGLTAPVIISPHVSGFFSQPYLFKNPGEVASRCRGYVPIAPVSTEAYTAEQYKALTVPTLIVCGDKDTQTGPVSVKNLRNLANCEVDIIDGGHPCYLDSPDTFHEHLYTFLAHLSS